MWKHTLFFLVMLLILFAYKVNVANATEDAPAEVDKPVTSSDQTELSQSDPEGTYGQLHVTALATHEGREDDPPTSIAADVYLNGVNVGTTPYRDDLPPTAYEVTVKRAGAIYQSGRFSVVAGETYKIEATFVIPMTDQERKVLENKKQTEKEARQKKLRLDYQAELASWQLNVDEIKHRRRPYIIPSVASISGAVVLGVVSGILFKQASDANGEMEKYHDLWMDTTNMEELEAYRAKGADAQDERNLKNALGIVSASLGGAALATGVVLLYIMPEMPEAPTLLARRSRQQKSVIRIIPAWDGRSVGMSIGGRF
ncbi:MAG: PEGA domain-containing protein [Myxococcota bacterium]|nr:PEGA domain-containing protein [Myxococcota bacterium]